MHNGILWHLQSALDNTFRQGTMRHAAQQLTLSPRPIKVECTRAIANAKATQASRGSQSPVAHKWANGLCHSCRLGVPNASVRGTKSEVAPSGQIGDVIRAVSGVPNASQRGIK